MVASRRREGYRIPPENRVYVRVNRDSSAIFGARTRVSLYILRKRAPRRLVIGRILMGVGQLSRRRETRRRPRRCDGTMDAGTINRGHRRQLQRRVPYARTRENISATHCGICASGQLKSPSAKRISHADLYALCHRILSQIAFSPLHKR